MPLVLKHRSGSAKFQGISLDGVIAAPTLRSGIQVRGLSGRSLVLTGLVYATEQTRGALRARIRFFVEMRGSMLCSMSAPNFEESAPHITG